MHEKDEIMPKYVELIYNGFGFQKQDSSYKIVDKNKNKVNGKVLKLYKGNITIMSRISSSKAYSMKKVSFEDNTFFKKGAIEKFLKMLTYKLKK